MNDKWHLVTRFEREAQKYNCDPLLRRNREQAILREFKRKAHQYIRTLPPFDSDVDWLSFIQHYGGPTRLLDFTYSYYVSLFFATEASCYDCTSAIWAVNMNNLLAHLEQPLNGNRLDWENMLSRCSRVANANIKEGCKSDCVYIIEPAIQHERIGIQQGLFLFPANLEMSFEFNLCKAYSLDCNEVNDNNPKPVLVDWIDNIDHDKIDLLKISVPYHIHPEIIQNLEQMNINSTSLFPGLDGFTRSLTHHFRYLEYRMSTFGS